MKTLRSLSADECRALLRAGGIGRVGVSVGALPAIFPVRFALLGHDIVFPVATGSVLADAVTNAVVAFEADSVDDDEGTGWSVLVVGRGSAIDDAGPLDAVRELSVSPWGSADGDQFISVPVELISGREIGGRSTTGQP